MELYLNKPSMHNHHNFFCIYWIQNKKFCFYFVFQRSELISMFNHLIYWNFYCYFIFKTIKLTAFILSTITTQRPWCLSINVQTFFFRDVFHTTIVGVFRTAWSETWILMKDNLNDWHETNMNHCSYQQEQKCNWYQCRRNQPTHDVDRVEQSHHRCRIQLLRDDGSPAILAMWHDIDQAMKASISRCWHA